MANRYWVGGTGNWSDNTNHWSDVSGGSPGASKPTANDNVYFDENSFTSASKTVTINELAYCLDMDWTGALYTPSLAGYSYALSIYGNFTLISDMTLSFSHDIYFYATSSVNIFTAGKIFKRIVRFRGIDGVFNLLDDFHQESASRAFTLEDGTLNTNNYNIFCCDFNCSMSWSGNGCTINLGSSIITCTRYVTLTYASLVMPANTATFILTGNTVNFSGGGKTYNKVEFRGTPSTIIGSNTFHELIIALGKTLNITTGTTQKVSSVDVAGATVTSTTTTNATIDLQDVVSLSAFNGATLNYITLLNPAEEPSSEGINVKLGEVEITKIYLGTTEKTSIKLGTLSIF
jgi:hypothetical protein